MASLVKNGNTYSLIWTDRSRSPKKIRENLKTDDRKRAVRLQKQLEWGYANRHNRQFPDDQKHDPWVRRWYQADYTRKDNTLLSKLIEDFISFKLSEKGTSGWGRSAERREPYVLRKFVRIVGDRPVRQLTRDHLQAFYYRAGVNSDHTRQSDYISINTFLNWLLTHEYLETKPEYRPKKAQQLLPRFITPVELSAVIQKHIERTAANVQLGKCAPRPYYPVLAWMVLAGTGIRPVELSRITLSAVQNGHLLVGDGFDTKSRRQRLVPLLYESRQAVDLLCNPAYRKLQGMQGVTLLGRDPAYAKNYISRQFTSAWQACFPDKDRSLYNLKDMFAVRFLCDDTHQSAGAIRLNELKEILGHASLETTQKYLKAIPFRTDLRGTIFDFPPEN